MSDERYAYGRTRFMHPPRLAMRLLVLVAFGLAIIHPAPHVTHQARTAQAAPASQGVRCSFTLGFAALRDRTGPAVIGDCLENERFSAENGNAEQQTTRGLLVWRKADNWTAFTDGFRTWLNGPAGLQLRLNTVRLFWEGDFAAHLAAAPDTVTILAAGDIASCDGASPVGAVATARLLDAELAAARAVRPGQPSGVTVAALGDTAYNSGTDAEFLQCYDATWGRHRSRTRPAVGNHEYDTPRAAGYFRYFGDAAGDPARGYYAYRAGAWHILVLNTNCMEIGGCGAGSPQERWLRAELSANPTTCALAYMHQPRFSSGPHGGLAELHAIWHALYEAGVELVLAGHDHHYERFGPQDPLGRRDAARGVRSFVVGTGGVPTRPVVSPVSNSEVQRSGTLGILKLLLGANAYAWEFVAQDGHTFTDTGAAPCH